MEEPHVSEKFLNWLIGTGMFILSLVIGWVTKLHVNINKIDRDLVENTAADRALRTEVIDLKYKIQNIDNKIERLSNLIHERETETLKVYVSIKEMYIESEIVRKEQSKLISKLASKLNI